MLILVLLLLLLPLLRLLLQDYNYDYDYDATSHTPLITAISPTPPTAPGTTLVPLVFPLL